MRISDWSSDVCSSDPRSTGTANPQDAASPRRIAEASVHVDTQVVALWLNLLAGNGVAREWHSEIVGAYAIWSARKNGFGHPPDVEVDREPMEWNNVFYVLVRSEEQTSELQSLMRSSYADFCLKKKKKLNEDQRSLYRS